ncbi:uncharacterized protein ARMOST_21743 [Armillaria ostoyae]|uniref:Uncharacterized protein n=1 Tax=Armillaria ostoyae TaxID=47428 RepID=A0A284SAV9_ARMOS|nr:uncharacterized protein ARMOST_21743 [Armillaria ostoyae]
MSRSDIHDTFQPTLVSDSPASLMFFKRILGMTAEEILVKFEQICCAQSLSINDLEDSKDVRSQCTDMILQGLRDITGERNVRMNYINYETDIFARHHVRIDGWPIGIKFESLSNLKNLQDLRRLRDALKVTACKWVSMSQKQIDRHARELEHREAAGEVIKKKRREHSDAGTSKPKGTAERKKRSRNSRDVCNYKSRATKNALRLALLHSQQVRVNRNLQALVQNSLEWFALSTLGDSERI